LFVALQQRPKAQLGCARVVTMAKTDRQPIVFGSEADKSTSKRSKLRQLFETGKRNLVRRNMSGALSRARLFKRPAIGEAWP